MRLYGLFILRASEPESPELLTAWDEYSIDGNSEGWEDDKAEALALVGDDYIAKAVVQINISQEDVLDILQPHGVVEGTVMS